MGRSPCCDKNGLKKGPWTPEEDNKLIQHIQIHGPGNWRILPQNAGLQRCPKSCRLRWTNYLRPDIKRGRFSFEEEEAIIQLHSVLGNKWSAIAARLPGRTDNEIKNYWNTHIRKRLLRMGIDPVTHAPRLDLLDLSSLLNSSHINLSNLLRLQTLINPEALGIALNLLSSTNDQNPINNNVSLQNPHHQLPNQTPLFQHDNNQFEDFLSQQIPSSSLTFQDQSQPIEGYIGHFPENDCNTNSQIFQDCLPSTTTTTTTTISESDLFFCGVSDQMKGADLSENSSFDSVLSTPLSSPPPPLHSGSAYMSGSSENERGSFCSNLLRFEIPESLELDDFM